MWLPPEADIARLCDATENLAGQRPILRPAAVPAFCVGERLGERRYCNDEGDKSGGDYSHPNLPELPQHPSMRR
jgi:hypothetical protein